MTGLRADGPPILALDTATTRAVVALGDRDGRLLAEDAWVAGYRHGEELLARIDALLRAAGIAPAGLGAIVVGTGPGAFTGLRVGLATAKGLAYALRVPIAGVPTSAALRRAAGGEGVVVLLPAGPSDRVVCRDGEPPRIVAGGHDAGLEPGTPAIAVDLAGRAPDEQVARGEAARAGLAGALLALGARRLAAGDADDLARLVPEYVTLPRGVRAAPPEGAIRLTGQATR